MRILDWNVNGLYNTLKDAGHRHSSVSNYFSQVLRADILCFQEAKIQEEKLEKWMACVPNYESFWAFSLAKKGYSGVVTYVKEDLSPLDARADYLGDFNIDEDLCREGRLMETDHGSFVLINVYVPHGGECAEGRPRLNFKLHFLKALKYRCDELVNSGKEIVVLGDFNIAHRDIDVYKNWNIHDLYIPEEILWMDSFFRDYVDLFRHFHPDARDVFSCWDAKTEARIHNEGVRIDYAACSKGFLSQVIDAEIIKMLPKSWSDHAAILITLKEQPVLPLHHIPDISSRNMKRYKEDQKQKKLTALFSQHSLKSMPAHQKECASTEDEGGYTSINKIESARNMGTDLRKGGNIETLNEAASSNSKLENIDVGPLDGSKAMGPAHLSTTLMNKHPSDINNSNGSELAENVQFNQKHLGKLDSNGTAVNANGNHHSKEEQQSISSNITVSSLDYLGVAVIGKESENLTVKLNSLARDTSHSKGPVLQKILKEPLCRTEEKSKGSKKRKAEGKHLSGPASKQKGLESYFRTQNG